MIRRTLCVLGLAMTASLAAAAPSSADSTAQLNIEDSAVTLRDRPDAQAIMNRWRNNLGVDSVRIQAFWDAISREGFGPLDRGIARIRAAGMEPLVTIHEKGPQFPGEPSPAAYAAFARQVAARYAGSVRMYTIGNEPNQGTFLTPQRKGGRPYSPHLYRRLVNAAYPAIKSADPASFVIIGTMAPIGGTSPGANSVAPLQFLREMACVDRALRPVRTGFCVGFQPARGDGFAAHPYSIRYRRSPFQAVPGADLFAMGDLEKMFRVLDPITRQGRIAKAGGGLFPIYFTEYGYETNPPDGRFGLPPSLQDRWLQEAAYVAWKTRRVKMHNQYLYFDDPPPRTTFQTGLAYNGGQPKPALGNFPKPFYVDTRRPFSLTRARIWGQVRPGGATTVTIEQSPNGSTWSALGTARTNFRGYFSRTGPTRRGYSYRFRWSGGVSDARRIP